MRLNRSTISSPISIGLAILLCALSLRFHYQQLELSIGVLGLLGELLEGEEAVFEGTSIVLLDFISHDRTACLYLLPSLKDEQPIVDSESIHRLISFISVMCERDEEIVRRMDLASPPEGGPSYVEAFYVGRSLLLLGRAPKAISMMQVHPGISVWYVHAGRIAIEQLEDESLGMHYFRIAQSIDAAIRPEKLSMYMYLCLAEVRDGRSDVIGQPCAIFHQIQDDTLSARLLGRKFLNDGRSAEALKLFLEAEAETNQDGDIYYWIGKSYLAENRSQDARDAFQLGVLRDPEYMWNYFELSKMSAELGCYSSARTLLNTMIDNSGNDADARIAAQRELERIGSSADRSTLCSLE